MTSKLPPNKIFVFAGRVQKVETWVLWGDQPHCTISIERNDDGSFTSHIGNPESGGATKQGTLEQVLAALHAEVAAQYMALFALDEPTEDALEAHGFERYDLEIIPAVAA